MRSVFLPFPVVKYLEVGHPNVRQDYAREYVRLSLLGVENINALTECTEVLPLARSAFVAPDQEVMDRWLNSTEHSEGVADAVFNGDLVVGLKRLWGS